MEQGDESPICLYLLDNLLDLLQRKLEVLQGSRSKSSTFSCISKARVSFFFKIINKIISDHKCLFKYLQQFII